MGLMARVLTIFGVITVIPDYRNFPQTRISGMLSDIDECIQWTYDNCKQLGGDPNKIIIVGQSAGSHLGATLLIQKLLRSMTTAENTETNTITNTNKNKNIAMEQKEPPSSLSSSLSVPLLTPSSTTTWKLSNIKGFIAVSGPYNLVKMQEIFHQNGLSRNIVNELFQKDATKTIIIISTTTTTTKLSNTTTTTNTN